MSGNVKYGFTGTAEVPELEVTVKTEEDGEEICKPVVVEKPYIPKWMWILLILFGAVSLFAVIGSGRSSREEKE